MHKRSLILMIATIATLFFSCKSGSDSDTKQTDGNQPNTHKVVVKDVLHTSSYTYLQVTENNKEQWLAVPSMQAKSGETYYYQGGLVMNKFQSKELNRTFESVLFLEGVSTDPNTVKVSKTAADAPAMPKANDTSTGTATGPTAQYTRTVTPVEKKEIKIDAAKGGITIGELFAKKENYSGKTVKIKGEVTKFTPAVMNKNWIHIQDGTEHAGKFDMVITTDKEVNVGDKVTFEGKISLNKDLGYGYFFEVIMEDALIK